MSNLYSFCLEDYILPTVLVVGLIYYLWVGLQNIKIDGVNTFDYQHKRKSSDEQMIEEISPNISKTQFVDISQRKSNDGFINREKFNETEKLCLATKISSAPKKLDNSTENRNDHNPYLARHEHNFNPKLTKCIAIDCEMVGVDEDAKTNMLARVSVVNSFGNCIYDKFVKPIKPVTDYRTHVSGIQQKDLENGEDFEKVQNDIAIILKGRILVGHALKKDLTVLFLTHPRGVMRDTLWYTKFREGCNGTPSLKKLTAKYLNINIQEGEHNSIEDAKAAMMLYMKFRKDWEAEIRDKRARGNKRADSKTNDMVTSDDA